MIEIETGEWRKNMATKNTLYIYRRYKVVVKEEDIYRNDKPSIFLYRARANALGLNDFNRHRGRGGIDETMCGLCSEEVEDLGHFMLRCRVLEERHSELIERMRGVNDDETLGSLLFSGGEIKEVGIMIYRMWGERMFKLGMIEEGGAPV